MHSKTHLQIAFSILCIALLAAGVLQLWVYGWTWHDQQRIVQLVILFAASIIFIPTLFKRTTIHNGVLFIFVLGFISSFYAQWPLWALKEWAVFVGLASLAYSISFYGRSLVVQNIFLYGLALIAGLNALQFAVAYLTAALGSIHIFNSDMLFNGFSNPRFLNQFQLIFLPIVAALIAANKQLSTQYARHVFACLWCVLIIQWCLAFTLGGRGLWLALIVTHLVLWFGFKRFRVLFKAQAVAALLGFLLFIVLFWVIPDLLGQSSWYRDSLRVGLSARDVIWPMAWQQFLDHPWLGAGPVHFSTLVNPIAAHPHQVILQWLAEWGVIATLAAIYITIKGLWFGFKSVRTAQASVVDAALWISISGSLILAQVDGVFVMPYTETWLAIIIGLALARWQRPVKLTNSGQITSRINIQRASMLFLTIIATGVIAYVLVQEAPFIGDINQQLPNSYAPRFWAHGFIP